MTTTAKNNWLTGLIAALLVAGAVGTSSAGLRFEAAYSSGPTDVRVWMDPGYGDGSEYYEDSEAYEDWNYGDVYPSADDVVLYVRASRSCFTTVYIIDTEGFIHVIHPLSPMDDAYLVGGRVYRFYLRDYGFDRGYFGRGVAFAFAVSSPMPFMYAEYGATVFGPRFGFQIYGDPFIAARLFYASILPPACTWSYIGVGYARFYVRQYVRYPSYLCLGWQGHHGDRGHGDWQNEAHRHYRTHAKDPYRVLRPSGGVEPQYLQYTKINRSGVKNVHDVRMRTPENATERSRPATREKREDVGRVTGVERRVTHERQVRQPENVNGLTSRERTREKATAGPVGNRVDRVRSTKNAFVASKRNYETMRKAYDRSGDQGRSDPGQTPVRTKTRKVTERTSDEARRVVALREGPSKKSSSGASAKRTKL